MLSILDLLKNICVSQIYVQFYYISLEYEEFMS